MICIYAFEHGSSLLSHARFSFHVILQIQLLSVIHGIGALGYPIAQYEHAALACEIQIQFDVPMTEEEIVHIRM